MHKEIKIIINKCRTILSSLFEKYSEQLPYLIVSAIAIVIVILGIDIFLELTENLHTDTLAQFDTTVTQYIQSYKNPKLTDYFLFVTHVGDVYGYLIVFILCNLAFLFVFRRWQYVIQLSIVMVLALSSNVLLKKIINRARPEIEHLVTVETLSYPSGHAMTAMAFYGFLIYLFYRFKIKVLLKSLIIIFLIVLILSIGISRVYLGVHFPSDIVGGYIAGFIWVILCALVFNLIRLFRNDPKT